MPKKFLHDLFAGHRDSCSVQYQGHEAQVAKMGFKCDCDNLVATSPFVEAENNEFVPLAPEFARIWAETLPAVYKFSPSFKELRGPPAIG